MFLKGFNLLFSLFMLCFLTLKSTSSSTSDKVLCKWQYPDSLVHSYLCLVTRQLVKKAPVGGYLLDVVDHFFGGKDPTAWDQVKEEVEKHVQSKFDQYTIKTMDRWKHSMSARVQSCRLKTDLKIKISCYKNLQEDLSGYEPLFRGSNVKEVSMSLEYYDIYAATFMTVSNHLRNISGPVLRKSIERDIKHKAKIFSDYIHNALARAEGYVCRHIKIRVVEEYLLWKEERLVWPQDENIRKYTDPKMTYNELNKEMKKNMADSKCRFTDTTNRYTANIVDIRDGTKFPGGGFFGDYCRDSRALPILVPLAHNHWRVFMKMCAEDDDKKWLRQVREQLDSLKEIIVADI